MPTPIKEAIRGTFCYSCMPLAGHDLRKRCMKRGSHRPKGPVVTHDIHGRTIRPLYECQDCGTLVVAAR